MKMFHKEQCYKKDLVLLLALEHYIYYPRFLPGSKTPRDKDVAWRWKKMQHHSTLQ